VTIKLSKINHKNYGQLVDYLYNSKESKLVELVVLFEFYSPKIHWSWPFATPGPFARRKRAKLLVKLLKESFSVWELAMLGIGM
jgi:hypothetical protein